MPSHSGSWKCLKKKAKKLDNFHARSLLVLGMLAMFQELVPSAGFPFATDTKIVFFFGCLSTLTLYPTPTKKKGRRKKGKGGKIMSTIETVS